VSLPGGAGLKYLCKPTGALNRRSRRGRAINRHGHALVTLNLKVLLAPLPNRAKLYGSHLPVGVK